MTHTRHKPEERPANLQPDIAIPILEELINGSEELRTEVRGSPKVSDPKTWRAAHGRTQAKQRLHTEERSAGGGASQSLLIFQGR
jgi:hypothetical protein